MTWLKTSLTTLATLSLSVGFATAGTLQDVQNRGELKCGVHPGKAGFAAPDNNGRWSGLDADYCRALAAAVLQDADKVQFVPLGSKNRFTALQAGEVDVLARSTTATSTREAKNGVDFTTPNFYDGQGFLINRKLGVKSALQLDGATVCVSPGTTSEKNLNDYFNTHGMSYKSIVIDKAAETINAYEKGRCDVMTNDRSALAVRRLGLTNPEGHELLPETISKEPLGPFVRQGDSQWRDITTWVLYGVVAAEELGITQDNVDQLRTSSDNPEIRRMLGRDENIGGAFGLDKKWIYRSIKAVGNYGEQYDKYLGQNSRLNIERGKNNLWSQGGLLYPYPFR